jgi:phosphonate transport system permease protein
MPGAAGALSSPSVRLFAARWRELQGRRRRASLVYGALFVAALLLSAWVGEFNPARIAHGLPRIHEYVVKTLPTLTWTNLPGDLAEWFYGLPRWLRLLGETVLIAYVATLLGTAGAVALCFDAAQNFRRSAWGYWAARRLLEVARTIPDLVYALIFVFAFGIGPLAGILAIALHSMGGSGKLFAEAVENINPGPVDGLRAVGAGWAQTIRYAVLPQVLPNFTTFTLWRFEINVRTAAVVGFVGAGGIGQEFYTAIRMLYYEDISALLIMLVATVMLIDVLCEKVRHRMIGRDVLA